MVDYCILDFTLLLLVVVVKIYFIMTNLTDFCGKRWKLVWISAWHYLTIKSMWSFCKWEFVKLRHFVFTIWWCQREDHLIYQYSPYQAVTGKIYHLKQHFLPPASCDTSCDLIWSRKWINTWKCTKVYTVFLFTGHAFWKENIWRQSKILLLELFKLLSKDNGWFV